MSVNGTPRRGAILGVLLLALLFSPLDYSILEPAIPAIQAEFEIGRPTVSWVLIVFSMFVMIGAPLMAKLSDVVGRRRSFVLTVALLALGSLVAALAPSYPVLLVGRMLQGVGAGGIAPIITAIIGDLFPPAGRGRILGLLGVVLGLGLALGSIIGELSVRLGWNRLFFATVPVLAALSVAGWRLVPDAQQRTQRPFDWQGLGVLAVMIASLLWGLTTTPRGWPFIAFAVILAPVFWWIEHRHRDPLVPTDLLRSRQMVIASVIAVAIGFARTGLATLPELAKSARGAGIVGTAVDLLLLLTVSIVAGSVVSGALMDRAGSRIVIVAGLAVLSIATLMCARWAGSGPLFMLGSVGYGLGFATLVGAPVRHIFLSEAPLSDRGTAQGVYAVLWAIGQALSGVVVGGVRGSVGGGAGGLSGALVTIGVFILLVTVCALGLKGRREELATARG